MTLATVCLALWPLASFADDPPASTELRPAPIVLEPTADPHSNAAVPAVPAWDPIRIDDFSLLDQLGRPITLDGLKGKPWVASFIFTHCPGYCQNMCKKIYDLHERIPDVDVRFVSITVDPERDTVDQLRRFSEIFAVDPDRWLFLTGDQAEIDRLVRHGFKLPREYDPQTLEYAHSLSLVHVDADGTVLGKYATSKDEDLLALQRVLQGRMETPVANRPLPFVQPPPPPGDDSIAGVLPPWAQRLPRTNASLNALATLLLLVGFTAIKAKRVALHRRMMLLAFGVSVAFLACYLAYHFALHHYTGQHGKSFAGTGPVRTIYYAILWSHVVLAATVPILAPITIYRAVSGQFERHRRIARITFPIWLYVSVTGVIIYWMLYHW
jgi:protein SCO1/2/putative membrane protein